MKGLLLTHDLRSTEESGFKKQEGRPNGEQNTGIALYGTAG
jgi:hypothetical protein